MKNKEAKIILLKLYGLCFLGGEKSHHNQLTVHHIKPIRQGGKTMIDNLALLCRIEHDQFNFIETFNRKYGKELNYGFLEIKKIQDQFKLRQEIKELKNFKDYLLNITSYDYDREKGKGRILVPKYK